MDPSIVDHVLAVIAQVEKAVGNDVVMIVLDTFAKTIAAGGGDEDKAKDAIVGDVNLMVTITGEAEIKTASSIKSNDGEERPLFSFKSEVVQDGVDDDGELTTIKIVSRDEVDICDTQSKSRGWAKGLHLIRSVVSEAILESGKDHRVGADRKGCPAAYPRRLHKRQYVGTGDGDREVAERKAWSRNLKAAQDNGLVSGEMHQGQELIWFSSNKP